MRIVLDSNVVLSGILWSGVTRRLIDAAIEQRITLLTSTAQLDEIERVAPRKRFEQKMALHRLTPRLLVERYSQIATLIVPAEIGNVVLTDPDDDLVLAAAARRQRRAHRLGRSPPAQPQALPAHPHRLAHRGTAPHRAAEQQLIDPAAK